MSGALPGNATGYAAFALLGISMVVHLLGGIGELYSVIANSGIVAYAGLMLIGAAIPVLLLGTMAAGVLRPSTTYASLSGLMVLYIIAYADVHALGYLESITGVEFHTHDHNGHEHNGHDHNGHNGNEHNGNNGHDHTSHDNHDHGGSTVNTLGDHLIDDPVALVCKISEGTAAVLFALLAVQETE